MCPTDFYLGENAKVMILSVPEGHDKPYKYPGIFQVSEAVILNKVDTMPVFDFDEEEFTGVVRSLNPTAPIFRIAATKGEGVAEWAEWLAARIDALKASVAEKAGEGAVISRDEAFALVEERIPQRNLVNHCVATEIIMGALAERLGASTADVERWALAGLLHDLDYAETADDPARHGARHRRGARGLVDDEMLHAILGHADKVARETRDGPRAVVCGSHHRLHRRGSARATREGPRGRRSSRASRSAGRKARSPRARAASRWPAARRSASSATSSSQLALDAMQARAAEIGL